MEKLNLIYGKNVSFLAYIENYINKNTSAKEGFK
jgi:hypothetical protein